MKNRIKDKIWGKRKNNLHKDNQFSNQLWMEQWLRSRTWRKTNQEQTMWLQTRIMSKDKEIKVRTTSQGQLLTRAKVFKMMDTNHSTLKTDQETSQTMWESTEESMWEIFPMMLIDILINWIPWIFSPFMSDCRASFLYSAFTKEK